MADWQLSTCCEAQEIWFLGLAGAYFVINFLLWNTFLLKPMKLIAVFFHEYSHAAACWLTGGKVNAIEVYNNEGGVTKYQGGRRCIIIPGIIFFVMILRTISFNCVKNYVGLRVLYNNY
jgi:Peptidase M50B-like